MPATDFTSSGFVSGEGRICDVNCVLRPHAGSRVKFIYRRINETEKAKTKKGYHSRDFAADGRILYPDNERLKQKMWWWWRLFAVATMAIVAVTAEPGRTCEPIEIEFCKGIGYNVTGKLA